MILLVDVGNTNIVIGVYKENECIVSWRISTDTKKTSDEYSIQVMQLLNQYDLNPKEVNYYQVCIRKLNILICVN